VSGQNPREIAAEILLRRAGGGFIEDVLEQVLARSHLPAPDRGFCQELVYGVVRWQGTLDWLIGRKTKARVQKPLLRDLLRLGLYQIFWLDRVPDHAAVNESVEIARRKGFQSQTGFINAILRRYVREFEATQAALKELKTTDPALGWSHPRWLFDRWRRVFGEANALQLMEWNDQPPKTFARINTLKADPGKVLDLWRQENVEYDFVRHDWIEENLVFVFKSHPPLSSLESFRQGMFYVQDPGTLLSVRELNPQPGEAILDFCAAPGGKLTYITQLLKNEGRVVAQDTSPQRLKLINENCARLGVTCVEPVLAAKFSGADAGPFDRILVDAPCSNTGVMRRRVDLRWRINEAEITRLRTVQLDLLKQAALLLKPGGQLVYSTCSLEPEENAQVVESFLQEHPAYSLSGSRQLLPWVEGVDGAFVARLQRG